MRIHRTHHARGFTVLPNALLQDRRLSFTARGILVDMLSRPKDWSEDGRRMADTSPQGRTAVAKALRELVSFGYYRVEKIRRADGAFISVAHVFDTPQLPISPPAAGFAGPGVTDPASVDAQHSKNREKEPTPLPAQRVSVTAEAPTPAPAPADDTIRDAVALLFRVLRPEPRLRLGEVEARQLAPLVAAWLERGHGERALAEALLPDLPYPLRSPAALLRDRLTRKLPPPVVPTQRRWQECPTCGDPVPRAGICRPCAGLLPRQPTATANPEATARGLAVVRAILRARSRALPAAA